MKTFSVSGSRQLASLFGEGAGGAASGKRVLCDQTIPKQWLSLIKGEGGEILRSKELGVNEGNAQELVKAAIGRNVDVIFTRDAKEKSEEDLARVIMTGLKEDSKTPRLVVLPNDPEEGIKRLSEWKDAVEAYLQKDGPCYGILSLANKRNNAPVYKVLTLNFQKKSRPHKPRKKIETVKTRPFIWDEDSLIV